MMGKSLPKHKLELWFSIAQQELPGLYNSSELFLSLGDWAAKVDGKTTPPTLLNASTATVWMTTNRWCANVTTNPIPLLPIAQICTIEHKAWFIILRVSFLEQTHLMKHLFLHKCVGWTSSFVLIKYNVNEVLSFKGTYHMCRLLECSSKRVQSRRLY